MPAHCEPLKTLASLAPTKQLEPRGNRLIHIDALRGLLLVFMAINHIPSALHVITDHPFGYMSAAEGFVFLAGLMAGYVYTRVWRRGDFPTLRRACLKRATTIYRWHAGAFLLVLMGLSIGAFLIGVFPINTPEVFQHHTVLTVFSGLLLVQQPTLFDVLPLYCVLLVITPWCLWLCAGGRYAQLIFGSLGLWAVTNIYSPQVPFDHGLINTGAFNLAAWQLLYIGGLTFGHRWAERTESACHDAPPLAEKFLLTVPRRLVLIVLGVVTGWLFCIRHGFLPSGLSNDALAALTNKNNLAPLRLLDTALLLYLSYLLVSRFPRTFSWRPLASIGRASLAVFSIHILAAYAIQANPQIFAESQSGRWLGTLCMLLTLAVTAFAHAHLVKNKSAISLHNEVHAGPLQTRQPRARHRIVRHEPRSSLAADPLHCRSR
jgi:hypothetical protein